MPDSGASRSVQFRMRRDLVRLARRTGLLPLAERVRYLASRLRFARSNRDFVARYPDLATPPLFLLYDAYAHVDYRSYFAKGG